MVAEDIHIDGSLEIDLPNTRRSDLLRGELGLLLMYAIGPSGRQKTEQAGKIALGIKEEHLSEEQKKAYESVEYLMFHYWSNPKPFRLTRHVKLVRREDIPSDYLIREDLGAAMFLLLEYNPATPSELKSFDILKVQRRGKARYLPFVTTIESIKNE